MKKLISLILMLCVLIVPAMAEPVPAPAPAPVPGPVLPPMDVGKCGLLSMLNMSENEYASYKKARESIAQLLIVEDYNTIEIMPMPGRAPDAQPVPTPDLSALKSGVMPELVYYDTLDAMLMALSAGDITSLEIYQSVAEYLVANNDELMLTVDFDLGKRRNAYADYVFNTILGNDFAFLMLEDNTALRYAFNEAIDAMKADGTLNRLVKEQIKGAIAGREIAPIQLPIIEGAETIRVAVTGALPPMDYVAADGTPAGFNTAVLSEISSRIGKNIELLVVDSVGRATALSSGAVDAVFWTRTSTMANAYAQMSDAERVEEQNRLKAELSDEEYEVVAAVHDIAPMEAYGTADMPDGTIATEAYYSDVFVPVRLKQ